MAGLKEAAALCRKLVNRPMKEACVLVIGGKASEERLRGLESWLPFMAGGGDGGMCVCVCRGWYCVAGAKAGVLPVAPAAGVLSRCIAARDHMMSEFYCDQCAKRGLAGCL